MLLQRTGLSIARLRLTNTVVRNVGVLGVLPQTSLIQQRFAVSRAAKQVAKHPKLAGKALAKLPRFMGKYGDRFIGAPFSHIIAFLLVHELTAILPLFSLWYLFHVFDYTPTALPDWMFAAGEDFIRKMGERNGWTWITSAKDGSEILLQGVGAYAIVKATLPLRIMFSLWCMPWTAKHVVVPANRFLGRILGLRKKAPKDTKDGILPEGLKTKKIEEDPTKPKL